MRTMTSEIAKHLNMTAQVSGFVQSIRKQSKVIFIDLRDRSGTVQLVLSEPTSSAFVIAKSLALESVITASGVVSSANGKHEMAVDKIEVLSAADPMLPIPVNDKSDQEVDLQKRLDWRWLDLRKPENALVFEVWTTLEQGFRDYWITNGFLEIHSPKLMSSSSESGSELFELDYFDRKAYLSQSPQFFKQMAMAAGMERIFEVGPVFRANPSFTSRHDTEFTGYDMEMSFIESHHDVMREEARLIRHAITMVADSHSRQIKSMLQREIVVPDVDFPKVSFAEAKSILASLGVSGDKPDDLSPEEEREISRHFYKETNHEFLFVHDYPYSGRAFYCMRSGGGSANCKSFDLLWNGLEITSGAQREHRYAEIIHNIEHKGLDPADFSSYTDFFRYGCPPHGGLGLSPSRMLMKLLGIENVREVTYLYRGPNRLNP